MPALLFPSLALLALGCTGELATGEPPLPTGNASAGTENTFDHPDSNIDVWELLDRMKAEGPPRYAARMHGCAKLKYDTLGRQTDRRATTIAGGLDGTIKRITTAYLARGLVDTVTQYDNASKTSGTAKDQVQYSYDDWGNLTTFEQDVDSAIGASGRAAFDIE